VAGIGLYPSLIHYTLIHGPLFTADAPLAAPLPEAPGRGWHRAVDTALPSPDDIAPPDRQPQAPAGTDPAAPHSVVVLENRPAQAGPPPIPIPSSGVDRNIR
jgi:hypothetical protein